MRLLSWNVNGIRSAVKKGLIGLVTRAEYDVLMFQEIKADMTPSDLSDVGYHSYVFPSSSRRGYSGTLTMSKTEPLAVIYGIGDRTFDSEGRVLTLEFRDFYVVNAYFPNSRRDLSRLNFKRRFNSEILRFCRDLERVKPVVIGGDFNVAHEDIDIARPRQNDGNAGFTREERRWFSHLLKQRYIDTYRSLEKGGGHYTWWTYRSSARQKNIGWRIDYFVVSSELENNVKEAGILEDVGGSDHAPIYLNIGRYK